MSRFFKSFRTNDLLSNTHNNERNKTMTNQQNPSSPESSWSHGYKRGKEDRDRRLRNELLWTERLESFISKSGLELPDRDLGILDRIRSFFARRWRSMITVAVILIIIAALSAISIWPHEHDDGWHQHFRNPLVVLTQNGSSA